MINLLLNYTFAHSPPQVILIIYSFNKQYFSLLCTIPEVRQDPRPQVLTA